MTIITEEREKVAVRLDQYIPISLEVEPAPVEISEEKPCYDLLCDQLRELLIEKRIIDEKGEFNAELLGQELPDLDSEAVNRLKNLVKSSYNLVFKDRSHAIKVPLSFIPGIVNTYLYKRGVADTEFVGGIVSYILGAAYYVAALESLGIENADSYVSEYTKNCISRFPPDIDIRTAFDSLSSDDLNQIESKVIQYISRAIFKEANRHTCTAVNAKAFVKKRHFVDLTNDYLIATFGDRSTCSVDNIIISKMEREQLFSRDALKIPCHPHFSVEEISGESCKPTSSWLKGWPAILSKLTKTISVKDPESVNHFGWLMLLSYISRGYSCLDKDSEAVLRSTLVDYLLKRPDRASSYAALVNKVVDDHQSNDFVSACFMHLNATIALGEFLTDANWKQAIKQSKDYAPLCFARRLTDLFWSYSGRLVKDQMKAFIGAEIPNYRAIEHSQELVDALADVLCAPYEKSDLEQQVQERTKQLQEVIQSHTKQNSKWVEALLEVMQHEEVPIKVITATLTVAASQHFQRSFDQQRESEYVLKKHCGEDYLQVRVRNLGKIQTLLLPYDNQKAMSVLSGYLSGDLSKSAYVVFGKFWNEVHYGAVCEKQELSRLHYLDKESGGVPVELPMNFGDHSLGLSINIEQLLLQFSRTGDKRILFELYPLVSEYINCEKDRVQKERVISQMLAVLHTRYPDVDFSSSGDFIKCKKSSQVKLAWLKVLIDLDDATITADILKRIKGDFKILRSVDHKTLLSLAMKKNFSKDSSLMIDWATLLLDKKVYTANECVEFSRKVIGRMNKQVDLNFRNKVTGLVHRLCSSKWKRTKRSCITDHPVYELVLSYAEWLIDNKHGKEASSLLIALPDERIDSKDGVLRHLWMLAFDELMSVQDVDLEQVAEHWHEGVRRSIVNIRRLSKGEMAHLIVFANLLLKSENTSFQELACSLARGIYKTDVPADLLDLFSLLYSDYYQYLVKAKKTKDIEATVRSLKKGSLSSESIEAIENKQFEYLLGEKKFDKALLEISKYFAKANSSKHKSKVGQLVEELLSYEKLTRYELGQRFAVVKSLFLQKHELFTEALRNTPHLERLIGFIVDYSANSETLSSEQNIRFLFRVIHVLYEDTQIVYKPTMNEALCSLLTENLSSVHRCSLRVAGMDKESVKNLIGLLVQNGKNTHVIKLLSVLHLHKMVSPSDKQCMEWIILFTDEEIRKEPVDPEELSTSIQLSRALLTNYSSSKEHLSEPFSRIAIHVIEQSIHEKNMEMMHAWSSKLSRLLEENGDLEIDDFDAKVKTWIDVLRADGKLDDATTLMKTFEGEDLSANLPTTLSLIKARVEEKQYVKALELLQPYKRKDIEECEELKECVRDVLSELLIHNIEKNTFTLVHQALMKTTCRDLTVWKAYLDQCLHSKSVEFMERGRKGFMNLFSKSPEVKKTIEYKCCYAQIIELVCQSQPEKSIEFITKLPSIWKVLKGDGAIDLRRQVTKMVILTLKNKVIVRESISGVLLDQLIKLFQNKEFEALFKDDLVTKSLLELSGISVFFRVNNDALLFAVVNWFMGYPIEYRGVKFTDEHYDVFNEIIDAIVHTECKILAGFLQLYNNIFSLIKSAKNKKLHNIKFIVHCLSHENPILVNYSMYETMKVFPFITECMKDYSQEVALKDLESSSSRSRKKGAIVDGGEIHEYCKVFDTFCWLLLNQGAYHSLTKFIEDPDLTLVVPPSMVTAVRKKIIEEILNEAVILGDRPSIDRAITFYIGHHLDVLQDREFHLACLDKVFDLSILHFTKYKDYSSFINSVREILACVYQDDKFNKLSFFSLIRAAFGPKIEAPEGVSDGLQQYPVVGHVLMLNEKQVYYKSAIMMVQKLLRAKTDDPHAQYLQLTVAYMILSQLVVNKKKGSQDLLECIRDFFLSEIPLNDISLYANHVTRCLGLLCTIQQTGMLYYLPDLYAKLCMALASPRELSKMVRRENMEFYRETMVGHIKRFTSQNTYTSLKSMFTLFYRSFPVLFKSSPEFQRKAFHHIFEAVKVNPLEKFPTKQSFEIIYEELCGEKSKEVKKFLMDDLFGNYGIYQDVLNQDSYRAFVTPVCSKMEFVLQMLLIDQYKYSDRYEPVDIKLDPSIMVMAGSVVGEVIVAEANEENCGEFNEFFGVVTTEIITLLSNKKIQGKGFGLCIGAITNLSQASIKLYELNKSLIGFGLVYQMIKEYSLSSSPLIGAAVLQKWLEAIFETGDDVLIANGQLILQEAIVDLQLNEVAPDVVLKIKEKFKIVE